MTATDVANRNNFVRMVAVKEQHAEICKKELQVLWSDYFKPEHLEKHPTLHDVVWKTTKLTSTVKQQINMEASQQLLAGVRGMPAADLDALVCDAFGCSSAGRCRSTLSYCSRSKNPLRAG